MCICVLYWYHFYLKEPGGSRIAKKNQEVCYWKGLATQAELYDNPCKICQYLKKIKTLYGSLLPKNISELRLWDMVNVDLIGPYIKYIIQQQPGSAIINDNASLTCMTMIDPAMGWFEIV